MTTHTQGAFENQTCFINSWNTIYLQKSSNTFQKDTEGQPRICYVSVTMTDNPWDNQKVFIQFLFSK